MTTNKFDPRWCSQHGKGQTACPADKTVGRSGGDPGIFYGIVDCNACGRTVKCLIDRNCVATIPRHFKRSAI